MILVIDKLTSRLEKVQALRTKAIVSHMLGIQVTSSQGFGTSHYHVWHQNLGMCLEKLSLEGFQKGFEDAYDVSRQSAFFDYLSYFVG